MAGSPANYGRILFTYCRCSPRNIYCAWAIHNINETAGMHCRAHATKAESQKCLLQRLMLADKSLCRAVPRVVDECRYTQTHSFGSFKFTKQCWYVCVCAPSAWASSWAYACAYLEKASVIYYNSDIRTLAPSLPPPARIPRREFPFVHLMRPSSEPAQARH